MKTLLARARERTLNIAHRGARSLAPENTLVAARHALTLGADMWEVDVAMSEDGVLYLMHDDTLERTTDAVRRLPARAPWRVTELRWEEIRQLDAGSWFLEEDPFGQISAGALTDAMRESYRGEPVPTLEEALRFTRDNEWYINVELKDLSGTFADASLVERAIEVVRALGMEERVLISSFNHDYLRRVKAIAPSIATGALVVVAPDDPVALLRELEADTYHPGIFTMNLDDIPPLRDAGVHVLVWTVNDPGTMRRLLQGGASGIFTDFPQTLRGLY